MEIAGNLPHINCFVLPAEADDVDLQGAFRRPQYLGLLGRQLGAYHECQHAADENEVKIELAGMDRTDLHFGESLGHIFVSEIRTPIASELFKVPFYVGIGYWFKFGISVR